MKHVLTIDKVVFGGEGLGFIDGKACFVPDVLPGEKVEIETTQDKKNFFKARLLKVLEASPHRISPPCPYVSHCGGCQYQHTSYEEELKIKEDQVREIFTLEFKLPDEKISRIVRSDSDFRYRSSLSVHVEMDKKTKKIRSGFIARDNHSTVFVNDCLLSDEQLRPVFLVQPRPKRFESRVSYKLSDTGECVSDQEEKFFRVRLGGQSLLVSSKGFLQNNFNVTEKIIETLKNWIDEKKPETFWDLYAGIGTFGMLVSDHVRNISCFEESPHAFEALRMNREERPMNKIEIVKGAVEDTFPGALAGFKGARSVLWMDPPRQGLDKKVCEVLARQNKIGHIGYLSCDLATQVRDLKMLLKERRYEIEKVVPFDMFPRTKHVEVAVFLKMCDGNKI